jgi:hypothetical protein
MKKIKYSFACYKNKKGELIGKVTECAKILAANWGNIPERINDLRAQEIHMVAQAYLSLLKESKKK